MDARNGPKRYLGLGLITAAVYVASAKLGLTLAFVAQQVTVVWPPKGIALAAVLLLGFRIWPFIFLGVHREHHHEHAAADIHRHRERQYSGSPHCGMASPEICWIRSLFAEKFDELKPDIVLLDIGLPRINGYEVAKRLRANAPKLKLIALTGYGGKAERDRTLQAGFDDHLVKPVDFQVLERLLQ